jgi:hypothetical protein
MAVAQATAGRADVPAAARATRPTAPARAAAPAAAARGCPAGEPAPGGVGTDDPFRRASTEAYAANLRGRELYQEQRFEEARAAYRAAAAADPSFLGPLLNIACSYARQERFGEAAREAVALAQRAYVPWGREILEAADLAPLRVTPEMKVLTAGLATAAAAWGEPLAGAMLFVARTGPPVRLRGEGALHLGLNQEIFAWLPATGRYRQVSVEDGRVLAFVRSPDGRTLVYVRAGKLLRAGGRGALRGLTLRMLDIASMTLSPPVALDGDIERLTLAMASSRTATLLVERAGGRKALRFDGERLFSVPEPRAREAAGPSTLLTPGGVAGQAKPVSIQAACRFQARDAALPDGVPAVRIGSGARSFPLRGPWGAGLFGLPFPE